jgi:hypothetical protein
MNEHYVDLRALQKDVEAVVPTRDDYVQEMKPKDRYDLNEQPTHKMKHADGTESLYYGASKDFMHIDPAMIDPHSLHYAANHRAYFIVQDKTTREWHFPTIMMQQAQSVITAKDTLVERITKGMWKVAYFAPNPIMVTLRDFLPDELTQPYSHFLKGVRTFYFGALHKTGLPEVNREMYNDFAWVPKRQLNKYFMRDYFEEFKGVLCDT